MFGEKMPMPTMDLCIPNSEIAPCPFCKISFILDISQGCVEWSIKDGGGQF